MTELQKTEFDMLRIFIDICDKLNLKYYLVCGTALGAVKYSGFIPWDDDVDVAMPREEYNIFLEKAPKMLPEKFFLQNYISEPGFPMLYTKMRNSETTFVEKSSANLNINHGVYIDIFPLDGYPSSSVKRKILEIRKLVYTTQAYSVFDLNRRLHSRILTNFWRLCGYHKRTAKTVSKLTKMISSYSFADSDIICNHGNWQGMLEYAPKVQYGKGYAAVFEGLSVIVPERYDEYLTQKYGEWRADLPKEKQAGHHTYTKLDLNNSYRKG